MLTELFDDLRYRALLLSNGYIYAVNIETLLVDYRIDCNGGLTGLTVTDYKLSLPSTYRDHGVDGLDTGLKRLCNRLSKYDSRGLDIDHPALGTFYRPGFVNRLAKGVNNPSHQPLADGNLNDLTGTLDRIALFYQIILTEDNYTDIILFKV